MPEGLARYEARAAHRDETYWAYVMRTGDRPCVDCYQKCKWVVDATHMIYSCRESELGRMSTVVLRVCQLHFDIEYAKWMR